MLRGLQNLNGQVKSNNKVRAQVGLVTKSLPLIKYVLCISPWDCDRYNYLISYFLCTCRIALANFVSKNMGSSKGNVQKAAISENVIKPTYKSLDMGISINYVRNFKCYLDTLSPFLHVICSRNVQEYWVRYFL